MRTMLCFVLLCGAAHAGEIFLEHGTDGIRHDLPANLDTSTATATITLVPFGGGTAVTWNIGSVPTEGPIATRRRTLTEATSAAAGFDWNLAEEYFLRDAPAVNLIETITVGPLVAQQTWLTWASDPQYTLFDPWHTLESIRFELTALGTNLNETGARSVYVAGTYRFAVGVPEPSSTVLLLVALCWPICRWRKHGREPLQRTGN